jgi:uncharacterized membrane protein
MTELIAELNRPPQRNYALLSMYVLGTFLAVAVAAYGIIFPILLPNIPDEFHQRYLSMSQLLIAVHVVGGGIALLISPFQFMIYRKNRTLHRYLGRVYFVTIMLASIGGYYMAWHAFGGIISMLGLGILSTLWWSCTLVAVMHARNGNIPAHRRWMIRSFALTYTAVTLRLMNPVLGEIFDDVTQFRIVYWISWSTNLVLAQCWLNWQERRTSAAAI